MNKSDLLKEIFTQILSYESKTKIHMTYFLNNVFPEIGYEEISQELNKLYDLSTALDNYQSLILELTTKLEEVSSNCKEDEHDEHQKEYNNYMRELIDDYRTSQF